MKPTIHNLLTKIRIPFNVNVVQFLNKKHFFQPLRNITNIRNSSNKDFKPNQQVYKYNPSYEYWKNVTIGGYCLLGIPIGAFILGTWQVQRHQWKLGLIDKLATRTSQEPIELLANLDDLESKEYYPVRVKGTFLYDKEFVIGYRSLIVDGKLVESNIAVKNNEAKAGYHVITPFKVAGTDLTILVNRGWVPKSHKKPTQREASQIVGETEIVGILRLNERRPPFVPKNKPRTDIWHYRDVNAMAEKAGTSPIYMEMRINNNVQQYPIAGQTKVELRNEHISYFLTWYCLSGATAYMWYQKFIRGMALIY